MRGKDTSAQHILFNLGITPAHAGKSGQQSHIILQLWDHPRACGEKSGISEQFDMTTGSPPRMRGKVTVSKLEYKTLGITPAHAGKSLRRLIRSLIHGDHPRACGEKGILDGAQIFGMGSPPRMRGKVLRRFFRSRLTGITPAHAGKSPALSQRQ